MDADTGNLWSLLFTTGYLTQGKEDDNGLTELVIPNKEVRWIFTEQIQEWFQDETAKDSQKLEFFCKAFLKNDISARYGIACYKKRCKVISG